MFSILLPSIRNHTGSKPQPSQNVLKRALPTFVESALFSFFSLDSGLVVKHVGKHS